MACSSIGAANFLPSKPISVSPSNLVPSRSRISFLVNQKAHGGRSLPLHKVFSAANDVEVEDDPEPILSGEWPENFSLLNYDDLRAYLEPEIFKDKTQPSAFLGEVMSTVIRTATIDQTVEEIKVHFEVVSGLPVVDDGLRCIGVISKKDISSELNTLKSKVGEVMSSPPITLTPEKTVLDAAALMLRKKVHRIPVVNEEGQVVGIVTRTDIFKALEGLPA
ncbi:hypothetical protein H6P81_013765 [Aristolochia fimbriata]|uniref:CBS domain-containing protein n=1 Tax=Aristolochia fimbriata TaxID=158543 RepID=A0AAV7EFM6_ARIFI|nr:hypothetical protein H6P81_013765 [Aristolochia fimbriata]